MKRHHVPIRSCVGCGQRSPQGDLLRFVAGDGALRTDPHRRAPGRGAYLHLAPSCWDAFVARKPPVRSLRRSVDRALREAFVQQLRSGVTR